MIHVINWFVKILTFGLVSIATITTTTYHVDDSIEELNDLTLNEVFDDGNLITNHDFNNNLSNWSVWSGTINNVNGFLFHDVDQGFQKIYHTTNVDIDSNDNIYFNFKSYGLNSFQLRPYFRSSQSASDPILDYNIFTTDISNILNTYSHKVTILDDSNYLWFEPTSNTDYYLDDIYLINLTDLGIDNLTQIELDEWYDIYVQANENEGVYIAATSHLNNNIKLVDVAVMVISFAFWLWLYKFLKGVVL